MGRSQSRAFEINIGANFWSRRRSHVVAFAIQSVERAHQWLEAIEGVGPKIAAAVLNTSQLRKPSLVIDTHHLRVMQRFGLITHGTNFVQAYRHLMPLVPETWTASGIDEHHMRVKRLGQTLCRPRHLHCSLCPLAEGCPTGQAISLGKTVYLGPEVSMEPVIQ